MCKSSYPVITNPVQQNSRLIATICEGYMKYNVIKCAEINGLDLLSGASVDVIRMSFITY